MMSAFERISISHKTLPAQPRKWMMMTVRVSAGDVDLDGGVFTGLRGAGDEWGEEGVGVTLI